MFSSRIGSWWCWRALCVCWLYLARMAIMCVEHLMFLRRRHDHFNLITFPWLGRWSRNRFSARRKKMNCFQDEFAEIVIGHKKSHGCRPATTTTIRGIQAHAWVSWETKTKICGRRWMSKWVLKREGDTCDHSQWNTNILRRILKYLFSNNYINYPLFLIFIIIAWPNKKSPKSCWRVLK